MRENCKVYKDTVHLKKRRMPDSQQQSAPLKPCRPSQNYEIRALS